MLTHIKFYKSMIIFSLIIFCFLHTGTALASQEDVKVYDYANLLSKDQINDLENLCNKYGEKGNLDIVIVTINDDTIVDSEVFLEDMYDTIGFGYNEKFGSASMIAVNMYTRKVNIIGFKDAETHINNDRINLIIKKITPSLTAGDYDFAFTKFIKLSSKYMNINASLNPDNLFFKLWFQLLISLTVGLVIVGTMAIQSGGKVTVNDGTYLNHKDSKVLAKKDDYIRTTVTRVQKPKPNNNGGGSSGGSSGGMSSGGHSHSSGSGSF